jgi:diphthamide synthase (EF-2-diphthine--ammonia ligase)
MRDSALPPELLGETIDAEVLARLAGAGVDLAGENGEFHTVVVDGPIFRRPVALEAREAVLRDGVWFADIVTTP